MLFPETSTSIRADQTSDGKDLAKRLGSSFELGRRGRGNSGKAEFVRIMVKTNLTPKTSSSSSLKSSVTEAPTDSLSRYSIDQGHIATWACVFNVCSGMNATRQ